MHARDRFALTWRSHVLSSLKLRLARPVHTNARPRWHGRTLAEREGSPEAGFPGWHASAEQLPFATLIGLFIPCPPSSCAWVGPGTNKPPSGAAVLLAEREGLPETGFPRREGFNERP